MTKRRVLPSLMGQRFARLVVVAEAAELSKDGKRRWVCRCDCGGLATVTGNNLKTAKTKSCGCLQRERREPAPRPVAQRRQKASTRTIGPKVPGGDALPSPVTVSDGAGNVLRVIHVRPPGASGPVGRPPSAVPGATQVGRMLDELTLQWEERTAQVA
jgi:hypothetical protein